MPTGAPVLQCVPLQLVDTPPACQRGALVLRLEAARSAAALSLAAASDELATLFMPALRPILLLLPPLLLWLLCRSFAFSSRRSLTSGDRLLIALPHIQSNETAEKPQGWGDWIER